MLEKNEFAKKNKFQKTFTLFEAAEKGDIAAIHKSIEMGYDVNSVDEKGFTPLIIATMQGHTKAIEVLLAAGAQIDGKYKNGSTALIFAASSNIEATNLLISKNANINIKNNNGFTPLMAAASTGHIENMVALIKKGADIDEKDKKNWTALIYADIGIHLEAINVLKEFGATEIKNEKKVRAIIAIPYGDLSIYSRNLLSSPKSINYDYGRVYRAVKKLERENLIDSYFVNIIKNTYPELFSKSTPSIDHLQQLFNNVRKVIENGLQDAKLQNKKFLLVAGEAHWTLNSLLLQVILLEAITIQDVNHLLVEMSERTLNTILYNPRSDKLTNQEYSVPYAFNSLNMKITPIDLLACGPHNEATMALREANMEKMTLECDSNGLIFCGSGHLQYFYENEKLKEKYSIVVMDITGYSDEVRNIKEERLRLENKKRIEFANKSDKVIRFYIDGNIEMFSPEEIIDWRNSSKIKEDLNSDLPTSNNYSAINQISQTNQGIISNSGNNFFKVQQEDKEQAAKQGPSIPNEDNCILQ